jgi:transposase
MQFSVSENSQRNPTADGSTQLSSRSVHALFGTGEPDARKFVRMTPQQWSIVARLHPSLQPTSPRRRGRPPIDARAVMDAVIWAICRDISWHDLAGTGHPPHQTCHRYFRTWYQCGLIDAVLNSLFGPEMGGYLLHRAEGRMRGRERKRHQSYLNWSTDDTGDNGSRLPDPHTP